MGMEPPGGGGLPPPRRHLKGHLDGGVGGGLKPYPAPGGGGGYTVGIAGSCQYTLLNLTAQMPRPITTALNTRLLSWSGSRTS